MTRVLVVDDDRSIRRTLEKFLGGEGYEVVTAGDGEQAIRAVPGADVMLLDLGLPGADGLEVLRQVRADSHPPPVIVITARDDMQSTVRAIQLGAYEYLVKPLDIDRLRLVVRRAAESREAERSLGQFVARETESYRVGNIIGRSTAIREVYKQIGAVSTSRATVLVRGESGTGKELVAKAIHYASADRDKPFVAVNCTAFAPDLLESELFGHVSGAFTGAVADKIGRFELAGAGTLFLDEIGELRVDLQAKLLRVVQERVFERVGDARPLPLRARIIAATHRDLDADHLELRAEVDEVEIARLAVGQRGWATADAYGERRFPGRVTRIAGELGRKTQRLDDPHARVDTRVLEVIFTLDQPDSIPLGLRMDVRLEPAADRSLDSTRDPRGRPARCHATTVLACRSQPNACAKPTDASARLL